MLKLIIKFLFSTIAFCIGFLFYYQADVIDEKVYLALFAAFGYMIMTGVDAYDYHQVTAKNKDEIDYQRNRRIRNILDNFKSNFVPLLTKLEIISGKSELSYEKIYEMSIDKNTLAILADSEYSGVR